MTSYSIPPVFERHAEVVRVVDGDTLYLDADLGCDTTLRLAVRLYGLNAPEMSTDAGRRAKAFVEEWVVLHDRDGFVLRTVRDKREKFGRYLADLIPLDGSPSLCQSLLHSGDAVPYMI